MLQVAHPTSDLFNVGWAPAPLYLRVNGINPNDAGPVICPLPPGGSFEVQLGILARPITGPHTLTVRGLATAPGVALISFFLLQGTSFIAGRSVQPTQSFVNYDLVLTENEVDLITDYTNLRVLVIASGSGGSGGSGGGSGGSGGGSGGSDSGSGGSGSGSGGSGVVVGCCPNPIPEVLVATISNRTGTCTCMPSSLSLVFTGPVTNSWFGEYSECGECAMILWCGEFGWLFGEAGCDRDVTLVSFSCDPLLFVYDVVGALQCDGTYRVTITE